MDKVKLLVVDDDPALGKLLLLELPKDGYEVDLVASCTDAVEYLKTHNPDLIVLDIIMPGMTGIDLLPKVLSQDKGRPVILHTAYSQYKDNFMTWSADAFVLKSSDLTPLRSKIKEMLKSRGLAP